MKNGRHREPKDSEIPVGEWLEQIGAAAIEYVGDDAGGGPPDYTIEYGGERIAVEVRLLDDGIGWRAEKKRAFERELKAFIEEASAEENAPKWHAWAEYDPDEPEPPKRGDRTWRETVRKALASDKPMEEVQLVPPEKRRGRGIVLSLLGASKAGSFNGLSEDIGMILEPVLEERIKACVKEKTGKVAQGARAQQYKTWWLVLDDEVLIAPKWVMSKEEQAQIEESVRTCPGRGQWSKIVVMSRFQTEEGPGKQTKWFWPVWEEPGHARLPGSPA